MGIFADDKDLYVISPKVKKAFIEAFVRSETTQDVTDNEVSEMLLKFHYNIDTERQQIWGNSTFVDEIKCRNDDDSPILLHYNKKQIKAVKKLCKAILKDIEDREKKEKH